MTKTELENKLTEYETRILEIKLLVKKCQSLYIHNDELVKLLAEIDYYSDFNQYVYIDKNN